MIFLRLTTSARAPVKRARRNVGSATAIASAEITTGESVMSVRTQAAPNPFMNRPSWANKWTASNNANSRLRSGDHVPPPIWATCGSSFAVLAVIRSSSFVSAGGSDGPVSGTSGPSDSVSLLLWDAGWKMLLHDVDEFGHVVRGVAPELGHDGFPCNGDDTCLDHPLHPTIVRVGRCAARDI